jgi:glyoxylase-like metal-dependent hydrolase (beta-lactamase superfamily II)
VRLYLLPLGYCRVDKGRILTPGVGEGEPIDTPVWAALLDSPVGWLLIDTGMHPVHVEDPDATFRGTPNEELIHPVMTEDDTVVNRLKEIGVAPSDIRYVINTHLHFDHCGGNTSLPDATFLVQRTEYEAAEEFPEEYHPRDYAPSGLTYEFLEGPHTVCPGVELIPTPGHTLGHQSVLVQFDERTVILPADAIVHREVLEGVQGVWRDPEAGAESVRDLVRLAETESAELLISHDPEIWAAWPHAPEAYA